LIDDCIDNATDYNAGGARYDTAYIQGVGLGTMADALTSIKFNVFDRGNFSLPNWSKHSTMTSRITKTCNPRSVSGRQNTVTTWITRTI